MRTTGIIFLIFMLMAPAICNAQLSVGPELGMNIIPADDNLSSGSHRIGLYAGLGVEYRLHPNISLSTGLFLAEKSKNFNALQTTSLLSSYSSFFTLFGIDITLLDSIVNLTGTNDTIYERTAGVNRQYYLELPVLIRANYKNLSIFAGPYAGLLLSARQRSETTTTIPFLQAFNFASLDTTGLISGLLPDAEIKTKGESTVKDDLAMFDIGLIAGIGYSCKNMRFNLCYSYGFTDYRKDRGSDDRLSHSAIRFSISYMFGMDELFSNKPSHSVN